LDPEGVSQVAGYQTDLYVASQSANELVVVAPPFNANSYGWVWISSLLCLAVLYGVLFNLRKKMQPPINPAFRLTWLIPIVVTAPFLVMGVIGEIKTQITLSANTGTLSVRETLFSISIRSKEYPFAEVRSIKVGVADVSLFLYVSLIDKPAENLTGATSQTGYNEVAEAMNEFLESNRQAASAGARAVRGSVEPESSYSPSNFDPYDRKG
jgi:hypothetical protein